jgi:WbqC-like protein family
MTLIVDSQYFSPSIFYKKTIGFSHIEIDVYDAYRKMSFRNRCSIAGANGPINLSIPLQEGRDQRRPAGEVKIANTYKWQLQHWRAITSCYNRSPWFDFYREELEELYTRSFDRLVDWNFACAELMIRKLGLAIQPSMTSAWKAAWNEPGYQDWRNKLTPKTILSDFPDLPVYRQVFEEKLGFIPHLSILDLLFCEGKNAIAILQSP